MPASKHDDGDSTHGPGWDDVYEYLDYLAGLSGRRVRLVIEQETSLSKSRYFRVNLWSDGLPIVLGEGSFGRSYIGGARTMAGAAYRACLRAEEALLNAADIENALRAPRRRRKTKKT